MVISPSQNHLVIFFMHTGNVLPVVKLQATKIPDQTKYISEIGQMVNAVGHKII